MSEPAPVKPLFNIGVIGPRPVFIGGHDDNNIRQQIKVYISNILSFYSEKYRVVGNTGLLHGAEYDFAQVCDTFNMRFNVFLGWDDQEKIWPVSDGYTELLEKASKIIKISHGRYSPKKNMLKYKQIIEKSDAIIYIVNPQFYKLDLIKPIINSKPTYIIRYG